MEWIFNKIGILVQYRENTPVHADHGLTSFPDGRLTLFVLQQSVPIEKTEKLL